MCQAITASLRATTTVAMLRPRPRRPARGRRAAVRSCATAPSGCGSASRAPGSLRVFLCIGGWLGVVGDAVSEVDAQDCHRVRPVVTGSPVRFGAHDREPDQPQRGVVVGEVPACLDRLADLHVQALDGVGGVDDAADLLGEGEEGDDPLPGAVPDLQRGGARLAVGPGGGELIEHLAGGVSVGCGVDPAQLAGAALAFSPGEIAQALADEVDDAGLVDRLREDGVDRLRETGEAVGADEEHVLDAAVAKLGHDARPEAGALGLLDPEAETVTLAFEGDPDRDVDRLLADDLLIANRDLHRVQVDGDVQLLKRPRLPGADVVLDRRGHLADQSIGDVDAVQLAQVPLDLAGRHPAGIQREDLIVEAVEGAGVLGHHLRLERGVAVARQLDRDRPVDGSQRLRRHPVAPVRQSVRAGQLLRPPVLAEQLIDQLVRDLHVAHQCVSFRAARRNRSDRGYAAIVPTPSDEPVRYTEIRALPPVAHRQGRDRRLQARPERAPGQIPGQLGARLRATPGTANTVQTMLAHLDDDRRQLAHLMAHRIAIRLALCLSELVPATTALRPVVDLMIDPLGRQQTPVPALMTRLPTLPAARPLPAFARRRARRVLAWWCRGIARVATEPLLEVLNPREELLDLPGLLGDLRVLRIDSRRERQQHADDRIPALLVDRLGLGPLHTARFATPTEDPSTLQPIKPCYFATPRAIPPQQTNTRPERLPFSWRGRVCAPTRG